MTVVRYRRNKTGNPDHVFFLTIVTRDRRPWIGEMMLYDPLWSEMKRVTGLLRFRFKAWVILPDHIHWLMQPKANDYSDLVSAFKRGIGPELKRRSALEKGGRIWEDRFWEETIRDDRYYERCIEYIRYNPVRHGLTSSSAEWRHSSFRSFVRKGLYPIDWAAGANVSITGAEYD